MRDRRLLDYYERELTFLRQLGAEFAENYEAVASRLRLEANRAEDPHVERPLEGFAFLAARVHLKIDDDFPEISQALLNVVHPDYLRPIPSMSLAEFRLDEEQAMLTSGWTIPRGARMVTGATTSGERCRFRTCYDTEIWPVRIADVGWQAPHEVGGPSPTDAFSVLRLDLETVGELSFAELEMESLRFYLNGEPGLMGTLYELLMNRCTEVVAWDPEGGEEAVVRLGDALRPVGFGEDDGLLPAPGRSFLPYRLIREYFTFPQKFHFVDVTGLERLRGSGLAESMQLLFYVSPYAEPDRHTRLQEGVTGRTLRLGCSPIVNLFEAESRPIALTERRGDYPVTVRGGAEVFSIEEVFAVEPGATKRRTFVPFYALRHGAEDSEEGLFWYARREPRSLRNDGVTDVSISFVDLHGAMRAPDRRSVSAKVLCSNGNLPNELPFGTTESDFYLEEDAAPLAGVFALTTPTKSVPPPLDEPIRRSRPRDERREASLRPSRGGRQLWRLVSMLAMNQLSLVDDGPDAFKEVLRLHNFGDSTLGDRHIEGVTDVTSEPLHAPVHTEHGLSFARGRSVEITFDEELFTGGGVYLFASVIERFLAQYASINSFVRLVARTEQRTEPMKTWPPSAGRRPLL